MTDRPSFRDAVAMQPAALEAARATTLSALAAVDVTAFRGTTALVGIGASLYAATAAAAAWRAQGLRAYALPGTDLYDPAVDAADAYVAVSASGRSVEPAKAVEIRRGRPTFGIAATAAAPLAGVVRTMIGTGSGPDSGPNTTSYVGSLQALGLLAERAGRPSGFDWARLPALVAGVLDETRAAVARASALLAGRRVIDCVGAGAAAGTAGYAALLVREAVRAAAQPWDTQNVLHGPLEPNDATTGVLLFGDGREVQLARDLPGYGIPAVLVTGVPVEAADGLVTITVPRTGNALADAILDAIPAQLVTADLAEAAGLPVCVFRYRQTDTKLPA